MKKAGYLYQCTIGPDGRIKNGSWTLKSAVPKDLPTDEMLFEDFPPNSNGGADYVWDGQELKYDPLPQESEDDHAKS